MQINVKITDLLEIDKLNPGHLFLVSQPIYDNDGAYVEDMPYTSNSIPAASLSSNIRMLLENDVLSVKNRWHFPPSVDNIPTQGVKLNTDDIINALNDSEKLSSIIDDGKNGWYKDLPSSTLQNRDNVDGKNQTQSISVSNDSIPNIDFVQRIVAQAYHLALTNCMANPVIIPSYVGEIIHSTVLSSKEMVREKYGDGTVKKGIQTPNTDWIKHQGYFLRASTDEDRVLSNSNNKDGGADSITLTIDNLPSHNHTATFTGSSSSFSGNFTSSGNFLYTLGSTTASGNNNQAATPTHFASKVSGTFSGSVTPSGTVTVDNKGGGQEFDNSPPFKNVYIWERVI